MEVEEFPVVPSSLPPAPDPELGGLRLAQGNIQALPYTEQDLLIASTAGLGTLPEIPAHCVHGWCCTQEERMALVRWKVSLPMAGVWNEVIFKVLSN